jgi:hypothetical protein
MLPIPADVPALVPLSHKQAPACLRLTKAPIQTNLQLGVSYTQRLCTRGCLSAIDSEHHHLLFECLAQGMYVLLLLPLANADLGSLCRMT